jgi:branched-chain amino acid transport system substrate-binding protein
VFVSWISDSFVTARQRGNDLVHGKPQPATARRPRATRKSLPAFAGSATLRPVLLRMVSERSALQWWPNDFENRRATEGVNAMPKKSRIAAAGALAAALAFLFCFANCSKQPAVEGGPIKIGAVLALTSRGATYGQRALHGMQLAVDELNATAFFRKRPLKLLAEDSQSTAAQALSAFKKLIDVDRITVGIGFVLSDEVLTCAPVANAKKVVLLTTAAGSDEIRDAGDYVFRNRESGAAQAEPLAQACIERSKLREIAILHSNSANGVSYRDGFRQAVERLGGSIVAVVGYNEGKDNFRAEIEKLRAKSPKAVYLAGLDKEMGLILKQAHELGFAPRFFASAGGISQKLLEIAGSGAEGLVCASAPFDAESSDPHVRNFANTYRSRFGEAPDFIAANSYDAVYMVADLFEAGAVTGEQIKTGLYAIRDFPGVGGRTTFDNNGEVTKPVTLVTVQNGRFVPVRGD